MKPGLGYVALLIAPRVRRYKGEWVVALPILRTKAGKTRNRLFHGYKTKEEAEAALPMLVHHFMGWPL